MTLLVVEEEENVVEEIREILGKLDHSIRIVGVTQTVDSVAGWLQKNTIPDLILVNEGVAADLHTPHVRKAKAVVTFSIDSEAYNFEAFRFNTFKPLLNQTPGRNVIPRNIYSLPSASYRERFLVKQGQRLHSILTTDIAYFLSEGRFIFFKTFDNQKYITEYRIEELEKMLSPKRFFRVNRSYIVSTHSVKQIHAWFGNRLKLYLEPDAEIEIIVSRERVKRFKQWLGK